MLLIAALRSAALSATDFTGLNYSKKYLTSGLPGI
jgi:hypothetical protein